MKIQELKKERRIKRKKSVKKKISLNLVRPRLCVFRSNTNIYAQIIKDTEGKTLVSLSSLDKEIKKTIKTGATLDAAKTLGMEIAKKALAAGVEEVVFDRNGYLYHGRVKALADGAREGGLKF